MERYFYSPREVPTTALYTREALRVGYKREQTNFTVLRRTVCYQIYYNNIVAHFIMIGPVSGTPILSRTEMQRGGRRTWLAIYMPLTITDREIVIQCSRRRITKRIELMIDIVA